MHLVPVDTQMTSASFTSEPGRENEKVNVITPNEMDTRGMQWRLEGKEAQGSKSHS